MKPPTARLAGLPVDPVLDTSVQVPLYFIRRTWGPVRGRTHGDSVVSHGLHDVKVLYKY